MYHKDELKNSKKRRGKKKLELHFQIFQNEIMSKTIKKH